MFSATAKQQALLRFIDRHIEQHGVAPTYREMMRGLGLKSTNHLHRMVRNLSERGRLAFLPGKARAVAVVRKRKVPLDVYTRANALLLMFNPETGKVDLPLPPPAGPNRPDG